MVFNENKCKEFEAVVRPVIKWINENCHPHVFVSVEPTHAELHEGIMAISTNDYVHKTTAKPTRRD